MIYSNDETDKSIRKKHYIFYVYILPILIVLGICFLIYLIAYLNIVPLSSTYSGYLYALCPGIIFSAINRKNWLKMPDGTFHFVKGIKTVNNPNFNDHKVYEAEFFDSKISIIGTIIIFLAVMAISIFVLFYNKTNIFVPIAMILFVGYYTYIKIKDFFDKNAKLKVAKDGLWTKNLGFKNWDEINFAEVKVDKSGDQPHTYLEIRLIGTKFEEADVPDERLYIGTLKDYDYIETIVNNSIIAYNEQKKLRMF